MRLGPVLSSERTRDRTPTQTSTSKKAAWCSGRTGSWTPAAPSSPRRSTSARSARATKLRPAGRRASRAARAAAAAVVVVVVPFSAQIIPRHRPIHRLSCAHRRRRRRQRRRRRRWRWWRRRRLDTEQDGASRATARAMRVSADHAPAPAVPGFPIATQAPPATW